VKVTVARVPSPLGLLIPNGCASKALDIFEAPDANGGVYGNMEVLSSGYRQISISARDYKALGLVNAITGSKFMEQISSGARDK
jgi:hypothetical protein